MATQTTTRYRVLVRTAGEEKFVANGLTFPTRELAEAYALNLAMRWTLVIDWRIEEVQE